MVDTDNTKAFMQADFLPAYSRTAMPPVDSRVATAREYIAYHMGQIDKKLEQVIIELKKAQSGRG